MALLLLAFGLRAYHLDYQSLWSDEGISLLRSAQPVDQMLRNMPAEHVPGYFLALHYWLLLAGSSDFALRYLSLCAGVLAIAVTYRLAADLGSRPAGLLAALLLATNEFQLWYAQEGRMYSWLLAAALLSTWLLWRLLGTRARRRTYYLIFAAYVLATAATIYLHYYGFLVPLAQAVFVAYWSWTTRRWPRALAWAAAGLAVLLLFLPWLPRLPGLWAFAGFREPRSPWGLPWQFLTAYTAGDAMPDPWRAWLPALYLALAAAGLAAWWRQNRLGAALLLSSGAVPLALALALALRKPDYDPRYTIFIGAPLLLLAARGLLTWPEIWRWGRAGLAHWRYVPAALATILAAVLLVALVRANVTSLLRVYNDPGAQKDDYRGLVRYLQALEGPDDVIVADRLDPKQVFAHYYTGARPFYDVRAVERGSPEEVEAALAPITAGARRVWSLRFNHPPGPVETWLAQHGWQSAHTRFGPNGLALTLYGMPGLPERDADVQAQFGPALRLAGASLAGGRQRARGLQARAGSLLGITTRWQVSATLPALNFSLRLQDAAGRAWLADDYVPLDGAAPTALWPAGRQTADRRGLLLPMDLPPGAYEIRLMLYDADTGAPLRTTGEAEAVTLAKLRVLPARSAPDPQVLAIDEREDQPLGNELRFLGWEITPDPLPASGGGTLSVWWQALVQPAQAYQVQIQLLDRNGQAVAEAIHPLSSATTNLWHAGEIVREQYALAPPATAASGNYRLRISLAGPDGALLGPALTTGDVALAGRARVYRLPRIAQPLDARLGEVANLRGYDVALPQNGAGDLGLTLYWQARRTGTTAYKVFVHVLDADGKVVAQADDYPAAGAAPIESWLPGEVVADRHSLPVPAAGRYRILVGLYDPASGVRVPAWDQAGQAIPEAAVPLGDVAVP